MPFKQTLLRIRRFIWRRLKRPGPPPGVTLQDAGDMFEKGMESYRQGNPQEALKIARQLKSYRYTGAWEIEAVALRELGDVEGAIEALRTGIERMPVWRNGHLLGIYLSDEGRYDEALEAFDASLNMLEPEPKMTAYNRAIVLNRTGRKDEAVMLLKELISSDLPRDEPEAVELAIELLDQLTGARPKPTPRRRSAARAVRSRRQR